MQDLKKSSFEDDMKKKEPLFTLLDKGDEIISKAKGKKVTALVGNTKTGKSTLFNYMTGKHLIGVPNPTNNAFSIYECQTGEGADMAPGVQSVTLVPNMIEYETDKFLIDMAGYGDTRNFEKVLGVSYMLSVLFSEAAEVRFIITVEEAGLRLTGIEPFLTTLKEFIKMFEFSHFTKQMKTKLFQSISLVVTKSQTPKRVIKLINGALASLKIATQVVDEFKEIEIEILEEIIHSNRIDYFQAAEENQAPRNCQIISRFNELKWSYFSIQEASQLFHANIIDVIIAEKIKKQPKLEQVRLQQIQEMIKQGVTSHKQFSEWKCFNTQQLESIQRKKFIKLPFAEKINLLPEDQQAKVLETVESRIQSYEQFSKYIITELVNFCLINEQKVDEKMKFNLLFPDIQKYLSVFDKYNTNEKVKEEQLSLEFSKSNKFEVVKSLLSICHLIAQTNAKTIKSLHLTFSEKINLFIKMYRQICDNLRKTFCQNQAQEKLILRLNYVLERGFREFQVFNQISDDLVSSVNRLIMDMLEASLRDKGEKQLAESFIKCLTVESISSIFNTNQKLSQLDEFLKDCESKYNALVDYGIMYALKIQVLESEAQIHLGNHEYEKMLTKLHPIFILIEKFQLKINNQNDENYQKIDHLNMKKLKIIGEAKYCLVKIGKIEGIQIALQLCKLAKCYCETEEIYEILIKSKLLSQESRIEYLQDYANYCSENGMHEKANSLMREAISLQKKSHVNYKRLVSSLFTLRADISTLDAKYRDTLSNWEINMNSKSEIDDLFVKIQKTIISKSLNGSQILGK